MKPLFPITAAAVLSLASCSTVTGISDGVEWAITRGTSHHRSFHLNDEEVQIAINPPSPAAEEASMAAGGLAATAATFVAGEVVRGIEQAAKNYSITYSAGALGKSLNGLKEFTVTRVVDKSRNPAAKLHFTVHEYAGGYQYVALDSIKVDRSKTAVPFWDGDLDVIVEIKIFTPKGGVNNATAVVTPGKLVVKDLRLGEERVATMTTAGDPPTLANTGLYEPNGKPFFMEITVQEVSDFNDVAEKGSTLIGKNKEDWQKKLADALDGGS